MKKKKLTIKEMIIKCVDMIMKYRNVDKQKSLDILKQYILIEDQLYKHSNEEDTMKAVYDQVKFITNN